METETENTAQGTATKDLSSTYNDIISYAVSLSFITKTAKLKDGDLDKANEILAANNNLKKSTIYGPNRLI